MYCFITFPELIFHRSLWCHHLLIHYITMFVSSLSDIAMIFSYISIATPSVFSVLAFLFLPWLSTSQQALASPSDLTFCPSDHQTPGQPSWPTGNIPQAMQWPGDIPQRTLFKTLLNWILSSFYLDEYVSKVSLFDHLSSEALSLSLVNWSISTLCVVCLNKFKPTLQRLLQYFYKN